MLCASQELAVNATNTNPNDIEEAYKLKTLLDATHSITETPTKPTVSTSTTSKPTLHPTSSAKEDVDYSFQHDRLPLLTDDEFNSLTEDANPLYFLKQLPEHTEPQEPKPSPAPVHRSPIFITIPIYINTSGKIPLTLTIGDQEMAQGNGLKRSESTKTPNSHFNRLLEMIEPPKRRTTNRHRSPSRSRIQALKEHKKLNYRKGNQ